ncbi:MAG: c-type cytochrome [Alphaproteobacteria bacterium]|nr:c-type cytochrome [Alphaproteobacteria bacterium]
MAVVGIAGLPAGGFAAGEPGAADKPPLSDAAAKGEPEKAQKTRGNLVGHGGPVKAIATDIARKIVLTGSFDYAMMSWDVSFDDARETGRFDQHDGAVNAVAFVPGGQLSVAAGDDGALSLWDLETGKLVHRFTGHSAKIVGVDISQDGTWALTSSWDRTARLWNLKGRTAGHILKGHQGQVNAAQFSGDGKHIFTASYDGTIRMFDAVSGDFIRPIHKHGWGINVLKRLPDGGQLMFGALDGTAAVIDIASGKVVAKLGNSERPILSGSVIDQPGLIAVGGGDGRVRVFRIGDFEAIEEYQNPYGPAWGLAFAPGGTALYIAGLDDFVERWTITPREPFEQIESPYPRRFQITADSDDPVAQGRQHFARKCSICHTLKRDGKNRAGPTLYGLFGRKIATLPGYPYSESLRKLDIVWSAETVSKLFELGPENFTPGSKMPLQKMTDKAQRDALVAFLKTTEAAKPNEPGKRAKDTKGEVR